jgi:AcrR family transcriptional regulator
MSEPGSRRGRPHDAEGAREAILNAAEEVFAEHGFDGARIDAIAAEAGYNKSLIFQYYGDKLNLYAEVLKRADKGTSEIQMRMLAPLLEDETATLTAHRFKAILEAAVQTLFDYLLEHPRFRRIILWEMAEGWQTYGKIISQFTTDDIEQFEMLFKKAHSAGLLRSDFDPIAQLTIVLQICISHLSFIPMYEMMQPEQDFSSHDALMRARDHIVAFVVAGMMVDPEEAKQ